MVAAGTRKVIFRRDQLRRFLIGELRHAAGKPLTSGELAERTMHKEGLKTSNRRDREDMLKRGLPMSAAPAHQGDGRQQARPGRVLFGLGTGASYSVGFGTPLSRLSTPIRPPAIARRIPSSMRALATFVCLRP